MQSTPARQHLVTWSPLTGRQEQIIRTFDLMQRSRTLKVWVWQQEGGRKYTSCTETDSLFNISLKGILPHTQYTIQSKTTRSKEPVHNWKLSTAHIQLHTMKKTALFNNKTETTQWSQMWLKQVSREIIIQRLFPWVCVVAVKAPPALYWIWLYCLSSTQPHRPSSFQLCSPPTVQPLQPSLKVNPGWPHVSPPASEHHHGCCNREQTQTTLSNTEKHLQADQHRQPHTFKAGCLGLSRTMVSLTTVKQTDNFQGAHYENSNH